MTKTMKFLMTLLAAMTAAFGSFGQVKISEYPNTNTLANTNLFVIAIKGATNMNISWGQLRFLILSDGTNTATYYASQLTNYVIANTNLSTLNATNLFVARCEIDSMTATNATNTLLTTKQVFYPLSVTNVFSLAPTNLVLDVNLGEVVVYATNGFSVTNFKNLETGVGTVAKYVNLRVIGCSNAMPAIVWPTFGAGAPQYSVCLYTNDARPIYTLITNANSYLYCMRWTGTNCHIVNYCSQ